MQLLSTSGIEGGVSNGLNLIKGNISKLKSSPKLRIPHVGWNNIEIVNNHKIIENIPNNTDFYFTHSYKFDADDNNDVLSKTKHTESFNSIIAKNNIIGVQFHPEKSGDSGLKLIHNFINL